MARSGVARVVSLLAAVLAPPGSAAGAGGKGEPGVIRDLAYLPDAGARQKLDLYLPAGTGFPVIVALHGGALMSGGKEEDAFVGRHFAAAGVGVAVVSYRLTPAVSHPAHAEDAAAAFAWVKRHIAEHGGRPDQVFVVGYSAGAYLAALLATDVRYLAAHGLSPADIRGLVPVSAFYWVERRGVAPDRDKRVWGKDPAAWKDASPANHLHAGVPPTLILYGDGDDDWRRRQNVEMGKALQAAGSAGVEVVEIAGRSHGSIWSGLEAPRDEVGERILAFVRRLSTATPGAPR